MGLRVSTYKLAINSTDNYSCGVTLKSRTLKRVIKEKGLTQRIVAKRLGMNKRRFIKKLYRRQRFNYVEVAVLVRLLGARAAIKVIWFPTMKEKKRIEKYVWENKMSKKNNSNCESQLKKKNRQIMPRYEQSGESWEQSEDFEKFIFNTDELPSRRLMRRRENG